MKDKLGRKYTLIIDPPEGGDESEKNEISDQYAIEFKIVRNANPGANTGVFKITNMDGKTEHKDRYKTDQWRGIEFRAGYEGMVNPVFIGNISEITQSRSGVDYITEITAYEGGYDMVNAFTSGVCGEETFGGLIGRIANDLKRTKRLVMGRRDEPLERRATTLFGNTWDMLMEYTDGRCFIDNERLVILGENEAIEGDISAISNSMGILKGFPKYVDDLVEFEMLLESGLVVGQAVSIEDLADGKADSDKYIVNAIEHNAVKDKEGGSKWTTKVSLQRKKQDIVMVK
jgi:hypothetical protein